MGLQGHSFGGYETNVLITGTNLFSCAQEGAGVSDAVSGYGGRRGNTVSSVFSYESGQYNLRTTPWERPDIYMENSPIFHVSEINTPLLMLHGEDDHAVSFSQAVELFTALRRLKKPVWLLDYGHDHILGRTESLLDFTIRQQQFFDHYLKGSPPPAWMTRGIPAKDKGIKSGLELDPGGKCSDTCPVCNPGLSINKTATESK
jgi:dipeptidyl aminopeptidase/acylaminoacyl peptidase